MSTPSLLTFTTLVSRQAAALQARCKTLIDLAVGSVTRAVLEANASIALWLQYVALAILSSTRLATSSGSDVDSWLADFGETRLPAVGAGGLETFGRYTSTTGATIPVGTTVRKGDMTSTYAVVADTSNPAYVAASSAYVIAAGTASVTVPVLCTVAGSAGNAVAGGVTLLGSALPGIDYCTNAASFTTGEDAESDASFKARFPLFLASLSKATLLAIEAAIAGVRQGLTYAITRNVDETGAFEPGHFVVTVDDGTGDPPDALLAEVSAAVDQVRAFCEDFSVQRPVVTGVNVGLYITVSSGTKANLFAPIATAITAFVDALPIGATLPVSRLASIAYATNATITNVTAVTANGSGADVTVSPHGVVKALSVTVS